MKKIVSLLLLFTIVVLMNSCKEKINPIQIQFEQSIKPRLLDPDSYTFLSMVKDTSGFTVVYPEWEEHLNDNYYGKLKRWQFMQTVAEYLHNHQRDTVERYYLKFRSKSKLGLDVLGIYTLYTSGNKLITYQDMDE